MADSDEMEEQTAVGDSGGSNVEMELTSASTTIDPSVVQSRIRQSASIQKEEAMDTTGGGTGEQQQPVFPRLSAAQASGNKVEYRRVRCPPHRYTPLREYWEQILTPLVEYLKLQVSSVMQFIVRLPRREEEICTHSRVPSVCFRIGILRPYMCLWTVFRERKEMAEEGKGKGKGR